jgi:hypothetical protein
MNIKKKQHVGFRFLTAVLAAVVTIVAAGLCFQPASAQNPGLKSTKTEAPLPVSDAAHQPDKKPVSYRVTQSQIERDIVLSG